MHVAQYVTANFNRSSSPATQAWLRAAMADGTDVIFGQELPSKENLNTLVTAMGYALVWPSTTRAGRPVSGLLVAPVRKFEPIPDDVASILAPFGSYVVAAVVDLPNLGASLCVSMHASPGAIRDEDQSSWPWPLVTPRCGSADGRYVPDMGKVFYSDLLLGAFRLIREASDLPLLAAGDLNEARGWDVVNEGHSWGSEFFDSVTDSRLHDVTSELWGRERRSRFHRSHPAYQLDFFLTSVPTSAVAREAWVDTGWENPEQVASAGLSDHAPVWLRA